MDDQPHLRVGDHLGGTDETCYLGGALGRDHYGEVIVEVIGADYVVVRDIADSLYVAPHIIRARYADSTFDPDDLLQYRTSEER